MSKQPNIRILVLAPSAASEVRTIPNELAALQEIVGGLIECFSIGVDGLIGVCNEEGLLERLPLNRFVPAIARPIVGTFFVAGDGVNFRSLTDEQIERVKRAFD